MTCAEPGCGGTVVDGYCDRCGTAPQSGPATSASQPSLAQASQSHTRATSSSRSARTGRTGSGSVRGRLGAGIVTVPRIPRGDPNDAILADPQVPESHRFCGNPDCGKPVGRARDGQPGRVEGFCAQCGTRYSFLPKLSRGELVGGQYEVQGCLAHGGLGWIYLAIDRNVHDRWVVLKGLLNSGDADAMAAAAAEVLALAEVEHPNIVRIHNFVQHPDATGVPVGYIVMEYIGGTSLKQIRKARNSPLPPDQAVAYMVEIAPALGYLHSQGLAYCDFKPDNVMQTDEQVKLIDLGAVMAMDDQDRAIYGTVGYQAPEIAQTGPTVASDVYTVGRTLAVLVMDVPQERGRFVDTLPGPDTVPVLAQHQSLHRAITRATDVDPTRRFSSMEELADQLTGVLHEIAAADSDTPQPRMSKYFSPQRAVFGVDGRASADPAHVVAAMSVPVVDPTDSGAALLATTSGTPPAQLEHALTLARGGNRRPASSSAVEIPLRLVRAAIEMGAPADARKRLDELDPLIPGDWRLSWYRGQCALLEREFDKATADFDTVLTALPGELAPKLALAATAELRGSRDDAMAYYRTVWQTDHGYTSAAFGLARQRAAAGDRAGAVTALDQIPPESANFEDAGVAAIAILLDDRTPEDLDEKVLLDAGHRAAALTRLPSAERAAIRLRVFGAALAWLQAGNTSTAPRLLGADFNVRGMRAGMEGGYREIAHETPDLWERIHLVEQANAVRPRTRL